MAVGQRLWWETETTSSPFPEKHTAFDQSPLRAVVKGCVLEIFGPNNVAAAMWESLVQPAG